MSHFRSLCLFCLLVSLFTNPVLSQQPVGEETELQHEAIQNAKVVRAGNRLLLSELGKSGEITIPRFYASIKQATWGDGSGEVDVHPEIEHWIVRWKDKPAGQDNITIAFDQPPLMLKEQKPVMAAGDGSLMLPGSQASTFGEKLRYEPQTFKNTVGYWVVPTDYAQWELQIDSPGEFNVGILQGCGKGQGGSDARLSLHHSEDELAAELDFQVLETGHFQNFVWRDIGQIEVTKAGLYHLKLSPTKIANKALMDVRAIHFVRRPANKK